MGLFFNTRTDKIKHLIGEMNIFIRELVTEMDKNGITLMNRGMLYSCLHKINQTQEKLNVLLPQLTASQAKSLYVPWLDGRMLPIFMYDGSYRLVMTQIDAEINQTIAKLLKEEEQRRQEEQKRQEEQRTREEEWKRKEEECKRKEEAIQRELTKEYNKLNTSITAETLESYISLRICCKTDVIIDWGDNTKRKVSCTDKYNEIWKSYNSKGNHKITIKGEVAQFKCQPEQFSSLNIEGCSSLEALQFEGNAQLHLDINNCPNLKTIDPGGKYQGFTIGSIKPAVLDMLNITDNSSLIKSILIDEDGIVHINTPSTNL